MAGQVRRRGAYDQSRVEQRPIDTRSFFSRVLSDLERPDGLMMAIFLIGMLAALGVLMPMIAGLSFIPIYVICRKFMHPKLRLHNFPFRVPAHLGVPDGSKKDFADKGNVMENLNTFKPEGKQFWGVSREDRLQVWASIGDLKTHMAILGGTGSGKTELLYALTLNQLVQDSGFIYTDAKGGIELQDRILEQLRRFDRHEDLLVITFAAGNRDLSAAQPTRITNTFNIMSSNSDSMLIEIISGMVSSSETGADMWEGRCLAFVAAITRPLVFLRDKGIIDLSPAVYMENMELSMVEQMVWESHPDEAHGIDRSLGALKTFLFSLPGYARAKKYKQDQKTNEQFGYISMQLTRVFNDLGFNYGHIFDAKVGEIDVSDVVLNRRCLNILLPSLERSSSTLTMLGRLIMGSIKQMMAGSLGSSVEGSQRLIVEARPTNAENVFRVILDEVGYIMVPGMSITAAQARSLNIAMTFAAQTFSDLKRGNAHEAEAIWDNTSLKLIGRLMGGEENTSETWQKVLGMAGHVQEAVVSGYNRKVGAVSTKYQASEYVNIQKTARIEVEYLRSIENGEFILFGAKKLDGGAEGENMIVPVNVLWAKSEKKAPHMRINDLIPVSKAGTRLDNSQAKNTLKSYLQAGSLHEQFQKMAAERRRMADGSFASLSLFEELCALSLTETQHSGLILPINFYKNLCDHVIVNSSDELSKVDAIAHANVMAGRDGETTNTAAATSLQTSQWIMADGNFSRDKNMFSEDDELSYKGAAHRLATESEPSDVGSDAVLTDSLHQTKVYAKSRRDRRTRFLDD